MISYHDQTRHRRSALFTSGRQIASQQIRFYTLHIRLTSLPQKPAHSSSMRNRENVLVVLHVPPSLEGNLNQD